MSLFSRKPKPTFTPFQEPDPAEAALDEMLNDPKMLALEATIDALYATLSTIPHFSEEARRWLCDLVYDGWQVSPYQSSGGRWMLDIMPPDRLENRVWTAKAYDAYVAGKHLNNGRDLCMCGTCVGRRQAEAVRLGAAFLRGTDGGGEVA